MRVTHDSGTSASYFTVSDREVARTVEVSDVLAADVDSEGELVGVDIAVPVGEVSPEEWEALLARFPQLVDSGIQRERVGLCGVEFHTAVTAMFGAQFRDNQLQRPYGTAERAVAMSGFGSSVRTGDARTS